MMEDQPIAPTDDRYVEAYQKALGSRSLDPLRLWQSFVHFKKLPTLQFANAAGAVYSANIEGISMNLRTYLQSKKREGTARSVPREQEEIEDLERAYELASGRVLNERNAKEAHALLTAHNPHLTPSQQGSYRTGRMMLHDNFGIVYVAVEGEHVQPEMSAYFEAINELRSRNLTVVESFYHAALLHLVFVHIHPFEDGNGRVARLIEKWFLADQRGSKAWKVPTEEFYWRNRTRYYDAVNLGSNFYYLNYDQCVDFLTLSVQALERGRKRAKEVSTRNQEP